MANVLPDVPETPTGAKYAANVNVATASTQQDVQAMTEALANHHALQMQAAKGGVETWEQTAEKAKEMLASGFGMSPAILDARLKGQAYNASQLKASADIVQTSYETMLRPLLDRWRAGDNGDQTKLDLVAAIQRHVAYMANAYGAKSEVGRALNAAKMIGEVNRNSADDIRRALADIGGSETVDNIAEALNKLDDPAKINRFIDQIGKYGWSDMVSEYFINSILSGPPTHAANFVGNSINVAGKLAETAVSAVVGGLREALGGQKATTSLGELGEQFYGTIQGMQEGWQLAKESALTGDSAFAERNALMSGASTGLIEGGKHIPGAVGEAIRLPSRALLSSDDFFKGLIYRMEINGLAYRDASSRGLTGDALAQEVARLSADPTEEIHSAAVQEARYRTFTDALTGEGIFSIEKWAKTIIQARMGRSKTELSLMMQDPSVARTAGLALVDTGRLVSSVLVPFIRTPIKIVQYANERSPMALLVPEFWKDFGAGGVQQEQALAKLSVGSSMAYLFYTLAAGGVAGWSMTGGGDTDPTKNKAMRSSGWQPYSLVHDGEYFQLSRFGNVGMVAGVAADLAHAVNSTDQKFDAAKALMSSLWQNFGEQTFWQGLKNFSDMVSDPTKSVNTFIAGEVRGFVPYSSFLARLAAAEDPVVRDTKDKSLGAQIEKSVESRIPGMSQQLPAQYTPTGKPIVRDQSGLEAMVSPVNRSTDKNDPALAEFLKMDTRLSGPPKKIAAFRNHDVQLQPNEYERFQQIYGSLVDERLDPRVTSDGYKSRPADVQKKIVEKVMDGVEKTAKNKLLAEFPDIRTRARAAKEVVAGAQRP